MALFKLSKGKRVKLSAAEESEIMDDRAAALAARDAKTEHKVELKVGSRILFTTFMENLKATEITAIKAAGYTVTKL